MIEERFSAKDLAPDPADRRAARRGIADRIAATACVLAAGVWIGGLIALGACAAPFVFKLTPGPFSGDAMGAAFARFDQIALGASVVILGGEVARTWLAGPRGRSATARLRRLCALLLACAAAYGGLALTPRINEMHRAGVRRGDGPEGQLLDEIHHRAETVGKGEVALGIALIALHVFTLRTARREDEDDEVPGPLPPGPSFAPPGPPA